MLILIIFITLFLLLGIWEQTNHRKNVSSIPVRIQVNGIRGKSTTTRLIAAGLRESGLKVLAKTTGTLPRLILEDGTEIPVKRRGPANIKEQIKVFAEAAKRAVDVIAIECMAINPELQWVCEHKMVNSTIGVITNIRADHLEIFGPKLDSIAEALKLTIPRSGILVTAEKKYLPIFKKQADKLHTKVIQAGAQNIPVRLLKKFKYINFPENLAIALEVTKLLGVKEEIAIRGMLKAAPDPGAAKIYRFSREGKDLFFVSAFAVNDPESFLLLWERLEERGLFSRALKVGVINTRDDRILRNFQFAHTLAEHPLFSKIILIGSASRLTARNLKGLKMPRDKVRDLSKISEVENLVDLILKDTKPDETIMLVGMGNTKDMGQKIIGYFEKFGEVI